MSDVTHILKVILQEIKQEKQFVPGSWWIQFTVDICHYWSYDDGGLQNGIANLYPQYLNTTKQEHLLGIILFNV
jgi:hypothetical protein